MQLNRNQDFMFEDTTQLTTNAKSLKGALNEVNASLASNTSKLKISNGRIKPEWYGALYGGNDDTTAFQSCINDAQTYGYTIELSDVITIKNEILISKAVKIVGIGEAGNSAYRNSTTILFDNSTVDGSGNATKALFRIKDTTDYQLAFLTLENITIKHVQQTPKNQHSIILDNSVLISWKMRNVKFYNVTGYGVYLTGTPGTPGAYYLDWDMYFYNCGGAVGQLSGLNVWVFGGKVFVDIENAINPTSPQTILCDFSGFRSVTFETIIEGNGATGVTSCIKIDKNMNKFKGAYFEIVGTKPTYAFDIYNDVVIESCIGVTKTFPINITGNSTVVRVKNANPVLGNGCFQVNSGNFILEDAQAGGDYSSGLTTDNLFVDTTLSGRQKIINSSNGRGVIYSHDISKPLYQMTPGIPFTSGTLNDYITTSVSGIGSFPTITPILDAQAGRVLQITPSDANPVNLWRWQITVPNEFIGSYITVGMKIKFNAATLKSLDVHAISGSTIYAKMNGTITDTNGKKNTWVYVYSVIKLTSNTVYVFPDYDTAPFSTYPSLTTIYLADFQVWLGNVLPTLNPYFISPVSFKTASMPTTGYYVTGDYAQNTTLTEQGTAGSKYIIKGWTRATTGTNNALNTDWFQDRALTGN